MRKKLAVAPLLMRWSRLEDDHENKEKVTHTRKRLKLLLAMAILLCVAVSVLAYATPKLQGIQLYSICLDCNWAKV